MTRHTTIPDPGGRGDRAATLAIALAGAVALAVHLYFDFLAIPHMANPGSGTPWAPHSDALGPWLDGGLAYAFGLPPPYYLYRPTVGMFWGSLLGATGRIDAIAIFFAAWLVGLLVTVSSFASDRPLRSAVVLLLGFVAIRFPETWLTLNLNVDFAAMVITLTGMLLVLWDRGKGSHAALFVGCIFLGVSAAIRGPMMFAGPLVLAVRLLLMERPRPWVIGAAAAVFIAPMVGDLAIQRHFGTANNGLQVLFCVYADPSHGWTTACGIEYNKNKPPGLEVFRNFIAFRLSGEGLELLSRYMEWRTLRDLRLVHSPATLAIILGLGALASSYARARALNPSPFVKAVFVAATLAIAWWLDGRTGSAALVWIVGATMAAAATRHWRAFLCLAAYLAGTAYLIMAGLLEDRLQHTHAFALVLGIGLLVLEEPRRAPVQYHPRVDSRLATTVSAAAALAFLYAGWFAYPSGLREVYLREVHNRAGTALKIGGDDRLDRSLYYTHGRSLVYTRHDELPVGAVRRYRRVLSNQVGNTTFEAPNAFID